MLSPHQFLHLTRTIASFQYDLEACIHPEQIQNQTSYVFHDNGCITQAATAWDAYVNDEILYMLDQVLNFTFDAIERTKAKLESLRKLPLEQRLNVIQNMLRHKLRYGRFLKHQGARLYRITYCFIW